MDRRWHAKSRYPLVAEHTEPAEVCRRPISAGSRDAQVDLCAGAWSAPDIQCASHRLRAFAHAPQTVVAGAAFVQGPLINAVAIVPNAHAKRPVAVDDFCLYATGSSVA